MQYAPRISSRWWRPTVCLVAIVCAALNAAFVPTVAAFEQDERPDLPRLSDEASRAIKQFYEYDQSIPLEARIVEKKEVDGFPREKIVFRSTQGFLVPAYLQFPQATEGRFACVLLLHGWSGSKESWYRDGGYISGGNVRKALLRAGYAVLALDAQCHGDRIKENDFAPVNHYVEEGARKPRKGYFTQREIYMQTVVDYRRAIDYLATRHEIDTNRLGIVGYSMGGTQTFLLTGVEPRVKVAVACAVPADREKWSLIAPQHYAESIRDRPLLTIMGEQDTMCRPEDAKLLHERIGSSMSKQIFFDAGHKLPLDYVPEAVAWITRKL